MRRERLQGAGLDLALPYLLLAPGVLIVLAVLVYPLWDGLRASTKFYRYGKPLRDIGWDNYTRLWEDEQFRNALWVTVRFVTLSVGIETVLGLALALFWSVADGLLLKAGLRLADSSFRELDALGGAINADPEALAELNARYGLEMQPDSVPGLLERFGLQIGEHLTGGWTPPVR